MGLQSRFWLWQLGACSVALLPVIISRQWLALLLLTPLAILGLALLVGAKRGFLSASMPLGRPAQRENVIWERLSTQSQQSLRQAPNNEAGRASHLDLVHVGSLVAMIKDDPDNALQSLFSGTISSLLRRLPTGEAAFALISYRQCRVASGDGFTMDFAAAASIARVAAAAGIEYLWLDAWCYRPSGDTYEHEDFIRTLAAVASCASAVVWLPRARDAASPSYQFRLWCTFEAMVVAERNLPVHVAGVGLSRSQRLLARYGARVPALPGVAPPPEVRELAYFNISVWLFAITFPPIGLIPFVFPDAIGKIIQQASFQLGQQVTLAINGQLVLKTMLAHVASGAGGKRHVNSYRLAEKLRGTFPWLPAYDRRDALLVCSALDHVLDQTTERDVLRALALSSFVAELSSNADTENQGSEFVAPGGPTVWLSAGAGLQRTVQSLGLDEPTLCLSSCDSVEQPQAVPVESLSRLGWTFRFGATALIETPVGCVRMIKRNDSGSWQLGQLEAAPRPPPGFAALGMSITMLCYSIGSVAVVVGAVLSIVEGKAQPFVDLVAFTLFVDAFGNLVLNVLVKMPQPVLFSHHFGHPPHLGDLQLSYSVRFLLASCANCFVGTGGVWGMMWLCIALRWPSTPFHITNIGLEFGSSPDSSQFRLVMATVVFCCEWNMRLLSVATSVAFHLWYAGMATETPAPPFRHTSA